MYNITLIGTNHSEKGECNSDTLYKIIEDINPEVIFEEIPRVLFDMFYNGKCHFDELHKTLKYKLPNNILDRIEILPLSETPLEINCVKKYLQNYNIKNITVDIDINSELSTKMEMMFGEFYKHDDVYKKLVDKDKLLTEQYGFDYLNSEKYLDLDEKMKLRERQLIESNCFNKNELLHIYELSFKEIIDDRENAMLRNIYNYSKENVYNQAVFLIGARHRKSIMQKIIKYDKAFEIKLIWTMYGNK
jgi:hypothetical protein